MGKGFGKGFGRGLGSGRGSGSGVGCATTLTVLMFLCTIAVLSMGILLLIVPYNDYDYDYTDYDYDAYDHDWWVLVAGIGMTTTGSFMLLVVFVSGIALCAMCAAGDNNRVSTVVAAPAPYPPPHWGPYPHGGWYGNQGPLQAGASSTNPPPVATQAAPCPHTTCTSCGTTRPAAAPQQTFDVAAINPPDTSGTYM